MCLMGADDDHAVGMFFTTQDLFELRTTEYVQPIGRLIHEQQGRMRCQVRLTNRNYSFRNTMPSKRLMPVPVALDKSLID